MKITKIERQKKQSDRYSIYLDGEFAFGVHEAVLIHFALHKDQILSQDQLNHIKEVEYREKVYSRALHYLSFGLRSIKEMRDYLASQEWATDTDEAILETQQMVVSQELIESTLQRLCQQNYLNDLIYAQSYTRTMALINRKGPKLIAHELKQKGLDQQTISLALDEYSQVDQMANVTYLIDKYCQTKGKQATRLLKNKLYQHLLQKGYDKDQIKEGMDLADFTIIEAQEDDLLAKEAAKQWQRLSRRQQGGLLRQKVTASLMRKGFSYEAIQTWLNEQEDGE
ncbi:RecX family transcriptional regulator [Vaginisenegalia massiliensis]|uniref:RecX family transcriptional regulator n=1 Tax=Vaginisenegalia massiliensis TaxID=2058294 RepID=UPI000F530F83|nr:RecX family transcriptional regulator [Vaginisenegalia massiliensis]